MSRVTFAEYEGLCSAFAESLSYPQNEQAVRLAALASLKLPHRAKKALSNFQSAVANFTAAELQELYTRTFDLSPLCSPALSVHLFGIESFKRSHLMVGLLDMYKAAAFDVQGETADHMNVVMRFLPFAPASERGEIIQYILIPALTKMSELIGSKQNPYAHLLEAIIATVGVIETTEVAYA